MKTRVRGEGRMAKQGSEVLRHVSFSRGPSDKEKRRGRQGIGEAHGMRMVMVMMAGKLTMHGTIGGEERTL